MSLRFVPLVASSQSQDQVQGRFLLNVVVRQRSTVLELLASEDQPLLVRGDAFLVLNLSLHIVDGVRRLNFQGDGFSGQSFYKDLHTSTEPQDQVQGRFLLNVVVRQRSTVLELLASEDQPLLVRGDAFLVLNLSLHI